MFHDVATGRGTNPPTNTSRPQAEVEDRSRLDLGALGEGTLITTADGLRQIEHLQPGDVVLTSDGPAPIRNLWAIPGDMAPEVVVRMRKCFIKGSHDLYGLPSQPVQLQHGLEEALFATRVLLVSLGDMVAARKADLVARHDRQLYRLDLGQTCCITANGHGAGLMTGLPGSGHDPAALRFLSRLDAIFALKSTPLARARSRTR